MSRLWCILVHVCSLWTRVFVVCSTKTCPTTRWTGWASRPPCTETRTAPGPCRRCTSTTGPSCTLTSTRTPPTPIPCLPVWAPPLTTLSREIKTLYTGRCKPPVRGETQSVAGRRVSRPGGGSRCGIVGVKIVRSRENIESVAGTAVRPSEVFQPKVLHRRWERTRMHGWFILLCFYFCTVWNLMLLYQLYLLCFGGWSRGLKINM